MTAKRYKIYYTIMIGLVAGYIWILLNYIPYTGTPFLFAGCMVKRLTGIPCPSCGTTRSAILLLHGNWRAALSINPLGVVMLSLMLILPLWLLYDMVKKSDSLLRYYVKAEHILKQKKVAVFFATLILTNWIWNIIKGL